MITCLQLVARANKFAGDAVNVILREQGSDTEIRFFENLRCPALRSWWFAQILSCRKLWWTSYNHGRPFSSVLCMQRTLLRRLKRSSYRLRRLNTSGVGNLLGVIMGFKKTSDHSSTWISTVSGAAIDSIGCSCFTVVAESSIERGHRKRHSASTCCLLGLYDTYKS